MIDISLTCAHHPQTPTLLRCNRCDQPVCIKCIVLTQVGYRCKACMRSQEKVFETAQISDYILVSMIVMALAGLGSVFSVILPLLTALATPMVASLIVEVIPRVIKRRWSHYLGLVVISAFVIGCVPVMCSLLTTLPSLWRVSGCMVYLGVGVHYLRERLRGIVL